MELARPGRQTLDDGQPSGPSTGSGSRRWMTASQVAQARGAVHRLWQRDQSGVAGDPCGYAGEATPRGGTLSAYAMQEENRDASSPLEPTFNVDVCRSGRRGFMQFANCINS